MVDDKKPSIVIKKIKKAAHGSHGGAWKVAYADFVTAMMAFFLLMWLLNATTDKTKRGITNYFSPIGTTKTGEGSGGMFGGVTIQADGALKDNASEPVAGPHFGMSDSDVSEKKIESKKKKEGEHQGSGPKASEAEAAKIMHEKEEREFKELQAELKKNIETNPELAKLKEHLMVDITPEGLRIQLVDKNKTALFPTGSSVMFDYTFQLVGQVEKILAKTNHKVAIYGHTDSTPYKNEFKYSNWELSSDRAHATRRALVDGGLDPERVVTVVGKADKDPLIKNDPENASNRRMSIILLRENPAPGNPTASG